MRVAISTCKTALTVAAGAGLFPLAVADSIIIDQPHDFVGGLSSEQATGVPFSRTADDFTISRVLGDPGFRADMIVSFPNLPSTFQFELYEDGADGPGTLLVTFGPTSVIDRGEWNGNKDLHLFDVSVFQTGLNLPPGTYWLSAVAIGNGSGSDRGFWGTAGNGQINGSEASFMSEHFGVPDWVPVSDPRALGFASDFAFTIEGIIPAPGALAVFGLAIMGATRRRRGEFPSPRPSPRGRGSGFPLTPALSPSGLILRVEDQGERE